MKSERKTSNDQSETAMEATEHKGDDFNQKLGAKTIMQEDIPNADGRMLEKDAAHVEVPWRRQSNSLKRVSSAFARKSVILLSNAVKNLQRPLSTDEVKEKYSIFLKDYKDDSSIRQYFMVIDLLRQVLMTSLILLLPDWPFTTITAITSLNFTILLILIFARPYKRLRDLIQNLMNEFCLIIASTSVIYMSYMEKMGDYDIDFKFKLGWMVVGANMFLIYFFILRFTIEFFEGIVRSIRSGVKFYQERRQKEIEIFKANRHKKNINKKQSFY